MGFFPLVCCVTKVVPIADGLTVCGVLSKNLEEKNENV